MPRGGAREGAGRPKGVPNHGSAELKAAAQGYTTVALETIAEIMTDPKQSARARVSAAKEFLDRGYGKAIQTADVNVKADLSDAVKQWLGQS